LRASIGLVARVAGPTILAAAVVVGAAEAWFRLDPSEVPTDLESIVLQAQQLRARTSDAADLLIVGDSSGLMDIDAGRLASLLGRRVESLAIIGFAGPRGFAALLAECAKRFQPATVLLVMHGESLNLPEQTFTDLGLEEQALSGRRRRPGPPGVGARRRLFETLVAPIVDFPLPGAYGSYYGMPAELRRRLSLGHGSLIDPSRSWTAGQGVEYEFSLSEAVRTRLSAVDAAVTFPATLNLVISPLPLSTLNHVTVQTRDRASAGVLEALGSRWQRIDTPIGLDDGLFATLTHLNAGGREVFTKQLAAALSAPPTP
jgi:hypothetical protein